jgi:methyltransferase (TIGR00027 family)
MGADTVAKGGIVETTADGLVVIRSEPRAEKLGILDPFAKWFISDEGHDLVRMAKSVDRVYEEFNLSRFKFTTSRLRSLAGYYEQMVFLGSGYDCRAIWLDEFKSGRVRIFEIDTSQKLGQKTEILGRHGVSVPEWNLYVPADVRDLGILQLLAARGFRESLPTLFLLEGLLFFLPSNVTRRLLDPLWLRLEKGSRVLFDCWSNERVRSLNRRIKAHLGIGLFQRFPLPTMPDLLEEELIHLGYSRVTINPLERIATEYYRRAVKDDFPNSWLVVEAVI